jgi:predicted flap endonuclease-1-like 5' DNA nuclease
MAKLAKVEGIGSVYAKKLKKAGVRSTNSLLQLGATPKGRKELATNSGLTPKVILEWVNHVDLFRIKGVGEEYADLLEEAGVDTVVELAQRTAPNLHDALVKTNMKKKLVRQLPSAKQVANWVRQAKKLPRKVSY